MSRRTARWIAGAVVVASLAALVASIPVSLASRQLIEPGQIVVVGDRSSSRTPEVLDELRAQRAAGDPLQETTASFNAAVGVLFTLLLVWLGVGFLVVSRQPSNWAGWLFLITGAPFPLTALSQALVIYGLKANPGSIPLIGLWATFGEYALYPIALLPLLFLLYPDGHPPSRRWRWAVIGLVGGTAIAILGFMFRPGPYNNWLGDGIVYVNPLGIDALAEIGPAVILVGTVIAIVSALSTVIAVRQRFKRSLGEERQQMRWIAFVASLAGFFFAAMWVLGFVFELFQKDEDAPVFGILFALTAFTLVLGIPAAYLVAIFKHGLWNLDVVIKKTVVFGILVVLITGTAIGLFLGVGSLLTDAAPDETQAVAALMLLLGLLIWPLRRLAGRIADRIVYGGRSTPYEVLTEFSGRLGQSYSTEDVLPRMAQILAEAAGASTTTIWLRVGNELRPEAAWPAGSPEPHAVLIQGDQVPPIDGAYVVEVRHQGELLGALTMAMPASDPMNPSKERLVRDLAAQAGPVLRNVRLLEDLRESRRRIVAAQDERAKQLERNIHDGAQQQLVALAVKLRLAEGLAEREPAKTRAMLSELQAEATSALEDLRDLARGIYPPLLADRGLPAALEAQARKAAVPVSVESDGVGRYSPDVESALYFCCLEALQNVAKYAHATHAEVRLSSTGDELAFEVADDGDGFDPSSTRFGSGLQGMADRLDAIGGRLEVRSTPGHGTTVIGRVSGGGDRRSMTVMVGGDQA
jgi:signal transduction histidine kinase